MGIGKALSLDPSNGEAYLLMGYLHLRQGKLEDALNNFNRSAALDSSNSVALCMVGFTYERMARPQDAEKFYRQALKIDPKDELAQQLMAEVPTR